MSSPWQYCIAGNLFSFGDCSSILDPRVFASHLYPQPLCGPQHPETLAGFMPVPNASDISCLLTAQRNRILRHRLFIVIEKSQIQREHHQLEECGDQDAGA
jgi:hypothetical protein